jgi:hypothetical protein
MTGVTTELRVAREPACEGGALDSSDEIAPPRRPWGGATPFVTGPPTQSLRQ